MERRSFIHVCLLLGLSVNALQCARGAVASEPLPDASVLAARTVKPPKQPQQPKPKITGDLVLTGVIEAVQSDGLKIKAGKTATAKNQEDWMVFARSSSTSFTIHGTATPDYLRKGQTVEFSGQIIGNPSGVSSVAGQQSDAVKATDSKDADSAADSKDADSAADVKTDGKNDGKADGKDATTKTGPKDADKAADATVKDGEKDANTTDDNTVKGGKVGMKAKEEKVAGKIKVLTIFSRTVGMVNKEVAKNHATNPSTGVAKTGAASDATLTVSDDATDKTGEGPTSPAKSVATGPKTKIVGRVESCDEKSITVSVGQRTIHADLAEIPTINVVLADPEFVADGKDGSNNKVEGKGASGKLVTLLASDLVKSKIIVHGTGAELNSDKRCAARSIDITLALPLSGKKPASSADKKVAGSN